MYVCMYDPDAAAVLYDDVIKRLLDDLLSVRTSLYRRRPSNPWFTADCRSAKRYTRRFGRAAISARRRLAASPDSAAAADAFVSANSAWLAQRRAYRQLRRWKCSSFWSNEFAAADSPQRIWSTVDRLLGRGRRACDSVSADALADFFAAKVDRIRRSTAAASPPVLSSAPNDVSMSVFSPISPADVEAAIARLPPKSSSIDPFPVTVLKGVADLLSPFLAHLFNQSFLLGAFNSCFKVASVTPIL